MHPTLAEMLVSARRADLLAEADQRALGRLVRRRRLGTRRVFAYWHRVDGHARVAGWADHAQREPADCVTTVAS